jgi:hypothetical protein
MPFHYWKRSGLSALLLFTTLLVSSCEVVSIARGEEPAPASATYLIPKGAHSAQTRALKSTKKSRIRFEASFDNSAIYATSDAKNQGDINKLFGISDCGSEHHTNSARFGWRWYKNRLEIHAYTYKNKVRQSEFIGTVELGQKATYEIRLEDEQYVFLLNDKKVTLPRACTGEANGYQLYPYFGGDETAPHDIKINIRELE